MKLKSISVVFLFVFLTQIGYGQTAQIIQNYDLLKGVRDSVDKLDILNRLGKSYKFLSIDSTFSYAMKAKRLAIQLHEVDREKQADILIAYSFYKEGLYPESLELYGQLYSYFNNKSEDLENRIRINLDRIEVLNKGIADKGDIRNLLQETIHLGKSLKKDSIMAEVYLSYCNRNSELLEDSVLYYLNKSKEIAIRYQDDTSLLFVQLWQARLMVLNEKLEEAKPVILSLIQEAHRIGNVNLEINGHFLMAGYAHLDPNLARYHYSQAFDAAQGSGNHSLEIYILTNFLEFEKMYGDSDQIFTIHEKLIHSLSSEWDRSRKFIGDYVNYSNMRDENTVLTQENLRRTQWLFGISIVSIFLILVIYSIMVIRNKKAKLQIQALNELTNTQIIAMEQVKQQAIRDEQQRLGQDLHDNLSASIAAIRHQLELLSFEVGEKAIKNKLEQLQIETQKAYHIARNKSHEWFGFGMMPVELSFEKKIQDLTELALPNTHYKKEILIDNDSISRIGMDQQIFLLRIIQELITNIIKHAKARSVSVLIYEEWNQLILSVKDDGKGFNMKKIETSQSTLGLKSIRQRVHFLGGDFKVVTGMLGTEIIIHLPLD